MLQEAGSVTCVGFNHRVVCIELDVRCSEYFRRQFAVVNKALAKCLALRESFALYVLLVLYYSIASVGWGCMSLWSY